nr:hypothetical protein DSAG12_01457 [Candidatus Prometheoarchaeum syntrophicum]
MILRSKRYRNAELLSSFNLSTTYRILRHKMNDIPPLHTCNYPTINCKNRLENGLCRNLQCCYEIDRCWDNIPIKSRGFIACSVMDININKVKEVKMIKKKKRKKRSKKKLESSIVVKKGKHKCEYCDKMTHRQIIHSNRFQNKIYFFCSMKCKENWIYKIHEKVK